MCLVRFHRFAKDLPQQWHRCGRSLKWTASWCEIKSCLFAKAPSHLSHLNGLSFSCTVWMCCFKWPFCQNAEPQIWQSNFLTRPPMKPSSPPFNVEQVDSSLFLTIALPYDDSDWSGLATAFGFRTVLQYLSREPWLASFCFPFRLDSVLLFVMIASWNCDRWLFSVVSPLHDFHSGSWGLI